MRLRRNLMFLVMRVFGVCEETVNVCHFSPYLSWLVLGGNDSSFSEGEEIFNKISVTETETHKRKINQSVQPLFITQTDMHIIPATEHVLETHSIRFSLEKAVNADISRKQSLHLGKTTFLISYRLNSGFWLVGGCWVFFFVDGVNSQRSDEPTSMTNKTIKEPFPVHIIYTESIEIMWSWFPFWFTLTKPVHLKCTTFKAA